MSIAYDANKTTTKNLWSTEQHFKLENSLTDRDWLLKSSLPFFLVIKNLSIGRKMYRTPIIGAIKKFISSIHKMVYLRCTS